MNKGTLVLLLIFLENVLFFWMITWIKNMNNFQIVKIKPLDNIRQHNFLTVGPVFHLILEPDLYRASVVATFKMI